MGELNVFPAGRPFAVECARFIVARIIEAVHSNGRASLVLSGGHTPRTVYEEIPGAAAHSKLDWSRVHLFWGDERPVPPDHPESNFGMAERALISHISIPDENIHRIMGELPPAEAAVRYRDEIAAFFGTDEERIPRFDVLLLGLGTDGHVASLFPGMPADPPPQDLMVVSRHPSQQTNRTSMTLRLLNHAACIAVLVAGQEKAEVLRRVVRGEGTMVPARQLRPEELFWLADEKAASLLTRKEEK